MLLELSRPEVEVFLHDFEEMPVRSSWFTHPLDPDLWCVDSEVSVRGEEDFDHSFFGYSASGNREQALANSCHEIVERLLATRLFQGNARVEAGWSCRTIFGDEPAGQAGADAILVRERQHASGSASGLGLHETRETAVLHGLGELIERHLLMRWWYAGDILLHRTRREDLRAGFSIDYYSTSDIVPLSLAVLHDREESMIFCGAAVKASWQEAEAHAREEALHLSTNHLVKRLFDDNPTGAGLRGNVAETISRVARLHGPAAHAMMDHIRRRTLAYASPAIKSSNWEKIAEAAFGEVGSLRYACLGRWAGRLEGVRVLAGRALTKNDARRQWAASALVMDPFC